jgi:cytochrome P450
LKGTALNAFIREVARHDAPIQNTRRFTVAAFHYDGHEVQPGRQVLLLLAAANRDPAANPQPHQFLPQRVQPQLFTFSTGAHRCPGEVLAIAITVGVITALREAQPSAFTLPSEIGWLASGNASTAWQK